MILLNVSFGIYAFLPQGWIFMICIVLIECVVFSCLMTHHWKNRKIYFTVIISNVISGLVGFIGSMILNGGWWLVIWFPWVSDNEVRGDEAIIALMIAYIIAFFLSVIIEGIINCFVLRKQYSKSVVLLLTIVVNVMSYTFGSLAMYSYSF